MFFNSQTCPHLNTKQQYKAIVFYNNKEEKYIAEKIKTEVEFENNKKIDVEIKPYKNFYAAEDYHQKYYFKRINIFFDEIKEVYPNIKDICKSTAVGHINGYVHGYGNIEKLMSEIQYLGLSKESQVILKKFVDKI
jgi:peptide-methionine (S)-S-oxide reductase